MTDINNYFKTLAISYADLAHTLEKPAFFREFSSINILFSNSDFLTKMRDVGRNALISQCNGDMSVNGANEDSLYNVETGTIYIITRVIDGAIDDAQIVAKSILIDILTKTNNDLTIENNAFANFNITGSQIHAIGRIADNFYGYAAFLSFQRYNNYCDVENSDKWS